jgi:hypothetical protein
MQHLETTEWIDYVRGVMPAEQAHFAAAHLSDGCVSCGDKANWLFRLNASAAREVIVPDAVLNVAKAILGAKARETEDFSRVVLRRLRAALMYDSMFDLQPAGARSLPLGCGSRMLLFRAGEYSVDLRLEAEPEHPNWTLVGQLSNDDNPSDDMANLPVLVMAGKKVVGKTFSNEFGEFILPDLPRQRLRLCVPLAAEGQQIDLALNRFHESPDPERN